VKSSGMARERSVTDAMSGMNLNYAEFADYTGEELEKHFASFKEFDIDDSGFITPESLKAILDALDVVVDMPVVKDMITEVAILCNHDDDGKLSFRDYMNCIDYEKKKDEHNRIAEAALESAEECLELGIADAPSRQRAISVEEAPPPPAEPEAEPEEDEVEITEKMRGTSFAVMKNVAQSRIAAFKRQNSVEKAAELEKQADVVSRIQKFKRVEADAMSKSSKLKLATENIELATLKNKLAAFEQAKKDADNNVSSIKKTWKKVGTKSSWGDGAHKGKRNIVGPNGEVGPPPPKSMAELLK